VITLHTRLTTGMTTLHTLRMPRGLWADLEESVIQQDRQFLTEVARTLGLSVPDVLKKCLGTGAPQTVCLIGDPSEDLGCCPWWNRSIDGMWSPCIRRRLTQSSPCQLHTKASPSSRLSSHLAALPRLQPVNYKGENYWVSDDHDTYREDGSFEPTLEFRFIEHRGHRICVAKPA